MGDCVCGVDEKYRDKYYRVRKKYENLRRHHKKLLGVSIELTQVLEEYVRGQRSPNVTETLVLCSKIYPSLFQELSSRTQEVSLEDTDRKRKKKPREKMPPKEEKPLVVERIEEAGEEKLVKEDKEYREGFYSRPKLPRTPNNN